MTNKVIVLMAGETSLADAERELILKTLGVCRNKAAAARQLGVDVKTIYNKLHSYGSRGRAYIR
jgi:DNA-binding NtrC family response regulator